LRNGGSKQRAETVRIYPNLDEAKRDTLFLIRSNRLHWKNGTSTSVAGVNSKVADYLKATNGGYFLERDGAAGKLISKVIRWSEANGVALLDTADCCALERVA